MTAASAMDAAVNFLFPAYRKDSTREQIRNGDIQCQRLAVAFETYGDLCAQQMSEIADRVISNVVLEFAWRMLLKYMAEGRLDEASRLWDDAVIDVNGGLSPAAVLRLAKNSWKRTGMMNELQSKHRDIWLGRVQLALTRLIDEAPDEACKTFGINLLYEIELVVFAFVPLDNRRADKREPTE
jgi:hypothetical protein